MRLYKKYGGADVENLPEVLKALSDETRLRIINLLYEKELCVCDIMAMLQITQAKASRHLIYLKNAGLVKDRKQAQWVYYAWQKNAEYKFIDSLVYDNLRNTELYKKDLKNLQQWLQTNENHCK
ncbi:DNA-binding transcriptional ArsR family regulator [Pectinatus brassicae]|uniref:DNA-binding transcriptional ArsR family regulator n=1 Tax=Pectinatus brassicae TaxID=862415 RepID=A0A840UNP2_9FIRM|nr:metalloregulator ArsR/SmtB family transcription factor [Pectinatus brassicae]MBB5337517.1 DNA-binding transcriptional ArsR family regulator [Pectinatus brassicae]